MCLKIHIAAAIIYCSYILCHILWTMGHGGEAEIRPWVCGWYMEHWTAVQFKYWLTFLILSSQALHALLFDLAYSICNDLSSPPSTSLGPACESSADIFFFIFSWSSQRRESKPLISATSLILVLFLKMQLKWNQLGT